MLDNKFSSRTDLPLCIIAAFLPFLLYFQTVPHWWISSDDPVLLAFAAQFDFREYMFNPEIWRSLTNSNLSPLVIWLYDMDLSLFGPAPLKFYLHNFGSSAILLVLTCLVLRKVALPWLSLWGTLLFCLSPVFIHATHFLMNRHYLEGLIWSLLALFLFMKSFADNKLLTALLSGFCYAVAILHKEIYAPLILVLIFLPVFQGSRNWKRIFFAAWPCLIVAALYPFYRCYMLGVFMGGYGSLFEYSSTLGQSIIITAETMWPAVPWMAFIMVVISLAGAIHAARRSAGRLFFILACCLGVLFPVYHTLAVISQRHLFLPVFFLITALVYTLGRLWNQKSIWSRIAVVVMVCVLSVGAVNSHLNTLDSVKESKKKLTVQGQFIWKNSGREDVLMAAGLAEWYVTGLRTMAGLLEDRELSTRVIINPCGFFYASGQTPRDIGEKIFRYSPESQELVRVNSQSLQNIHDQCMENYHPDKELQGHIYQKGSQVAWQVGPYDSGIYGLVSPDTGSTYHVPSHGKIPGQLNQLLPGPPVLCYTHPSGWTTCGKMSAFNNSFQIRR